MEDMLAYYESIAQVSKLMLNAARAGDWQTLRDGEECCAALIGRLKALPCDEYALDERATQRKRQIVRRILIDDAQIRDLTQPWLRTLDTHLGRGASHR